MTKYLGLQDIINSVEKSLENENYIAALALVLTIPDKCGKIEYPGLSSKRRYTAWYNTWCHCEDPEQIDVLLPDDNGEFIYQLRCAILHNNSTDIDYDQVEDKNKLDEFELELTDFNGCFCVCASGVINDGESRHMRIRIIDLCKWICYCSGIYYEKNKEVVDAANSIKIVDYRDVLNKNK